jgi:predicted Zn-dependent peptidase
MKKTITVIGWSLVLLAIFSCPAKAGEKQLPPEGGTPKDITLPAKEDFQLPNGLRATLVSYGQIPKVTVRLAVRSGNLNEASNEIWLAAVTGQLMKEGTTNRTSAEINDAAARMGGEVFFGVDSDQTFISGDVLSEFSPDFIRLVADIAQNPLFPEAELARLKKDFLRRLSIQSTQPQTLASAKFRKAIYGNHPYGRVLSTPDMIQGFSLEKVRAFYEANFGAALSHIFVVGQFDAQAVKEAIQSAFRGWKRGPDPLVLPSKTETRRSLYIVDRPGSQQSTIFIGLPVPDPSHKDSLALGAMNAILGGGGFLSRITANIREKKGYTYSPYSALISQYRDAYWFQFASVGNAVTAPALKEILFEIDRLRAEAPPEKELKDIQNFLIGNFVRTNSTRQGIIFMLSFQNLHGLPDFLTTYVKKIRALTPKDVQRVAQDYLRPEKLVIVVVGDKKQIADSMKEYGPLVD